MKRATKAALISGLVFPGTGHLYLKKYIPGAILVIAAFFCAYQITSDAIDSAQQMVERMQSSNGLADIDALLELAAEQKAEDRSYLSDLPMTLFTVFWLIGIADAYRIGRAQDQKNVSLIDKKN